MIKHLTKHGNSMALVIDRGVLDILQIDRHTPLSISTDGKNLVVSPIRDDLSRKAFKGILDGIHRRYGPALKRLADA